MGTSQKEERHCFILSPLYPTSFLFAVYLHEVPFQGLCLSLAFQISNPLPHNPPPHSLPLSPLSVLLPLGSFAVPLWCPSFPLQRDSNRLLPPRPHSPPHDTSAAEDSLNALGMSPDLPYVPHLGSVPSPRVSAVPYADSPPLLPVSPPSASPLTGGRSRWCRRSCPR